jgi:hypothetical protein
MGVLTVALSGCQSNPKPPPLESTSTSSSPTPTPSPTEAAPTMPAEAKGTSEAAAKAFVRHYIELINHATATGEMAPLITASDPQCRSCKAVVERIDGVYQKGGSIESEGWRIQSVQRVPRQPSNRPVFDVGLVMSPQRVVAETSGESKTYKGGRLPATFTLLWSGDSWLVLSWGRSA